MKKFLALSLISIIISACIPFGDDGQGEPAAGTDVPPISYAPTFVKSVRDINSSSLSNPKPIISRIENAGDKLRMYVQIVDSSSILTGASNEKWKKIWCEVLDSSGGEEIDVKFTIKEKTEKEALPLALAFVMDHSGSMGQERAITMQNAVGKFLANKRPDDYISLIKYDARVQVEVPMTQSKEKLISNFQRNGLFGYGGMTAISDGIYNGIQELKSAPQNYQKVVIVFTDGVENSSKIADSITIALAQKENVMICAVDYGNYIRPGYLTNFANSTFGIYHHIYLKDEFDYIFEDLYYRLNNYYIIEFEPEYYGDHVVKLKLCSDTLKSEVGISFNNEPKEGSFSLLNVYFDVNKSTIKKESEPAIKKLLKYMQKRPDVNVEIHGHTDSTGKTENNIKLSQGRAESVKNELIKRGIEKTRITSEGFGDTRPLATNSTEEGRAINRRTEFRIKKK